MDFFFKVASYSVTGQIGTIVHQCLRLADLNVFAPWVSVKQFRIFKNNVMIFSAELCSRLIA